MLSLSTVARAARSASESRIAASRMRLASSLTPNSMAWPRRRVMRLVGLIATGDTAMAPF